MNATSELASHVKAAVTEKSGVDDLKRASLYCFCGTDEKV